MHLASDGVWVIGRAKERGFWRMTVDDIPQLYVYNNKTRYLVMPVLLSFDLAGSI